MKFIHNHEIFSRINVRLYEEKDFQVVTDIIQSQDKMFGADISNDWNYYIEAVTNTVNLGVTVLGEIDGKVEGVMRVNYWEKMPFWSVGSNFTIKRQGLAYIRHRALSLSMYDKCMSLAEQEGRYDGYMIITDLGNHLNKRKLLHSELMPSIANRYIINDIEVIPPFKLSKFEMFNQLLGNLRGKNQSPIVVRHNSLKTEFRL